MKSKKQKPHKKFDLKKMKVANLDDLKLINGGYGIDGDIKTTTNTVQRTVLTD